MKEEGIVKTTNGDLCHVAVRRKTACGESCASCTAACSLKEQLCEAKNLVGAVAGDRVYIEIESKNVLKSAFLVYILPILVFLVIFAVIFQNGGGQLVSALISVAASAVAFIFTGRYGKKHKDDFIPQVTEIL